MTIHSSDCEVQLIAANGIMSVTTKNTGLVSSLSPENVLLNELPAHLRTRFQKAISLLNQSISSKICWQQIAEQSAISPAHFHRQFSQLFYETPGQYLNRIRLQFAIEQLLLEPTIKVTQVALNCGYSSSQAFAKALKRDLNLTAKEIKNIGIEGTPEQTSELLNKLAHPQTSPHSELHLVGEMNFEIDWYPKRFLKKVSRRVKPDVDGFDNHLSQVIDILPVSSVDKSWKEMTYESGIVSDERNYEILIPEGYYLCSHIHIGSLVGYSAAWKSLFHYTEIHNLNINEAGYCVEQVSDYPSEDKFSMTIFIQIPLMDMPSINFL
ncbi:MAG: helix-turn-helix transcriptional regulator [Parashewanella sp.]